MKNLIEKLTGWRSEPTLEPAPKPTFTATLTEIDSFKHLVMQSTCPGCGQHTIKVGMFGRGPEGWEASVSCKNCGMKGVVNSTGFKFEGLEKDGKGTK